MMMHPELTYWLLTDVAECLSISRELSAKLWQFHAECLHPTNPGETPDTMLDVDDDDDKLGNWWHKLAPEEQVEINRAYDRY